MITVQLETGIARPVSRAWIETKWRSRANGTSSVSPGQLAGRGLKRHRAGFRRLTVAVSPGQLAGRGLKQHCSTACARAARCIARPVSRAWIETSPRQARSRSADVSPGQLAGRGLKRVALEKPRERLPVSPGQLAGRGLKHPETPLRLRRLPVSPGQLAGRGLKQIVAHGRPAGPAYRPAS